MKNTHKHSSLIHHFIKQKKHLILIICIFSFIIGKLFAQNDEEWQILDQRMECVITKAAKDISDDEQSTATRYNDFASNIEPIRALSWDWNMTDHQTGDFIHWIIGAVFENAEEATTWWQDKGLHLDGYDDSNGDIDYWDYKKPENFHGYEAVLKYRGFEGTSVEGTFWWKTGRFIFQIGNISKTTKEDLVSNFLKPEAETIFDKTAECQLFDPIVTIDHFIFEDIPDEVYYQCYSTDIYVWPYDKAGRRLSSFPDSLSVSLIQNESVIESWKESAIIGLENLNEAGFIIHMNHLSQDYENVKILVQYQNIITVSTEFDIKYINRARFTDYPEEVSYEETIQLVMTIETLIPEITDARDVIEIREVFTGWKADINSPSWSIAYTCPSAIDLGSIDELWFKITTCRWSSQCSDEIFIPIEDAVVETNEGFHDVYSFGGEGFDSGNGIAAGEDPTEIFITGQVVGTALFGDQNLVAEGEDDIYIGKWNYLLNKFEWIQKYGSTTDNDSPGKARVVEDIGTLEIMEVIYNSGEIIRMGNGGAELVRPPGNNVVVNRINKTTGSLEWATASNQPGMENPLAMKGATESRHYGKDVISDNNGNCFVTGYYYDNIVFTGAVGTSIWASYGSSENKELFLVKFSNTGELQWGFKATGNDDVQGRKIITDSLGNVYLATSYDNSVNLESYEFNDGRGAFIIKFSPAGEIIWLKDIKKQCYIYGLVLDNNEQNFFITGRARHDCDFAGMVWENTETEYTRLFYAKFTTNGDPVWIKHGGTTSEDETHWPQDMDIDSHNNIYITGYFREGNLSFGHINLVPDNMASSNNIIFAAAFNEEGDVLWADKAADNPVGYEDGNKDYGKGISIDNEGNCYITGTYRYEATFGDNTITGAGETDAFIAKLSGGKITGIRNPGILSKRLNAELSQNFPNPFSQNTIIRYTLAEYGYVSIKVYNIAGEKITELVNKQQAHGNYEVIFNAGNYKPGLYIYQLNTRDTQITKKMILINNKNPK